MIDSSAIRAELATLTQSMRENAVNLRHLESKLDGDISRHHANTFRAIEATLAAMESPPKGSIPPILDGDAGGRIAQIIMSTPIGGTDSKCQLDQIADSSRFWPSAGQP